MYPPSDTGSCGGRSDVGPQNAVLASPRHWYPTTMLPALGGATQAPRERSARAPFDLVQGGGWLTPPTRSNASHQRTTLKPSALGESGWASCVARASRICTNCTGTRFCHFGAAMAISLGRIATPRGGAPSEGPRRARRDLGIDSEVRGTRFVPIRGRSCAVPAALSARGGNQPIDLGTPEAVHTCPL